MPVFNVTMTRLPRCAAQRWAVFVAGLWYLAKSAARRLTIGCVLLALPSCSELAAPSGMMPPSAEPPYVSLASKYLQSVLKDQTAYDTFEITGARWLHAVPGWSWLTCVHFHDHGHLRSYAIFIQDNAVVDARYAVETDACESQIFTPFDLLSGTLGRPTAPTQPPLY